MPTRLNADRRTSLTNYAREVVVFEGLQLLESVAFERARRLVIGWLAVTVTLDEYAVLEKYDALCDVGNAVLAVEGEDDDLEMCLCLRDLYAPTPRYRHGCHRSTCPDELRLTAPKSFAQSRGGYYSGETLYIENAPAALVEAFVDLKEAMSAHEKARNDAMYTLRELFRKKTTFEKVVEAWAPAEGAREAVCGPPPPTLTDKQIAAIPVRAA